MISFENPSFLCLLAGLVFAQTTTFAQPSVPATITQGKQAIAAATYDMDTVEGLWSVGGTVYVMLGDEVLNEIHQPDVRKMCTLKTGENSFTSYELYDEQFAYLYDTGGDTVFKVDRHDDAQMRFQRTSTFSMFDYQRFFAQESVWGYCKIKVNKMDTFEYSYVPPKEVTAYSFTGYSNPGASLRFDVKWTRIWPSTTKPKPVAEQDSATVVVNEKPLPSVVYGKHGVPRSVNKRKVIVSKDIPVTSNWVELRVWDKSRADGDIISIYYNGMWVLKDYRLTNEKMAVKIRVRPKKGNTLVFYAENLGQVPPNTSAMAIWDGTTETEMVVGSDLVTCGAVKLKLPED
jgi:hypothetical protein